MHKEKEDNNGGNTILPHIHGHDGYRTRELGAFEHGLLDGDMFLQVTTIINKKFLCFSNFENYVSFYIRITNF